MTIRIERYQNATGYQLPRDYKYAVYRGSALIER